MKYLNVRHMNIRRLTDIPQSAKAHRQPTKWSTPISKPETNGSIKASYTRTGACVSVDTFESRLKGRTLN